jgi:hypothetical protein
VINGKQLNPALVEWMMGFPAGWVTDLDLTRTQMLKCLGNAVVPQQAAYAVTELLRLAADEEPAGPQADEATLLPTPTANQPGGTWEAHVGRKQRIADGANRTQVTDLRMALEQAIDMGLVQP